MTAYWVFMTLGEARLLQAGGGRARPSQKLDRLADAGLVSVIERRNTRSVRYVVTEAGKQALREAKEGSGDFNEGAI